MLIRSGSATTNAAVDMIPERSPSLEHSTSLDSTRSTSVQPGDMPAYLGRQLSDLLAMQGPHSLNGLGSVDMALFNHHPLIPASLSRAGSDFSASFNGDAGVANGDVPLMQMLPGGGAMFGRITSFDVPGAGASGDDAMDPTSLFARHISFDPALLNPEPWSSVMPNQADLLRQATAITTSAAEKEEAARISAAAAAKASLADLIGGLSDPSSAGGAMVSSGAAPAIARNVSGAAMGNGSVTAAVLNSSTSISPLSAEIAAYLASNNRPNMSGASGTGAVNAQQSDQSQLARKTSAAHEEMLWREQFDTAPLPLTPATWNLLASQPTVQAALHRMESLQRAVSGGPNPNTDPNTSDMRIGSLPPLVSDTSPFGSAPIGRMPSDMLQQQSQQLTGMIRSIVLYHAVISQS